MYSSFTVLSTGSQQEHFHRFTVSSPSLRPGSLGILAATLAQHWAQQQHDLKFLWLEQTGNMNMIEMNIYYTCLCQWWYSPTWPFCSYTTSVYKLNRAVIFKSSGPTVLLEDPNLSAVSWGSHLIKNKKHISLQATIKISGQIMKTTQHALNIIHKSTSLPQRTFLQTKLADRSQYVSRSMFASPMFLWWGRH